jgi:predicted nuclease with TOPRIM domain
MTEKELLDLKEKVDEAKQTVSELTGQKNALLNQLKDDWGCKTLKEAKEKLEEMESQVTILEKKIERGVKELEEKYNV